jgi:hypothetical protein
MRRVPSGELCRALAARPTRQSSLAGIEQALSPLALLLAASSGREHLVVVVPRGGDTEACRCPYQPDALLFHGEAST